MFNNPELQRIYEESKPIVEAHLKKIDQLGKDITLMEKGLNTAGIGETPDLIAGDATLNFFSGRIWCRRKGRKDVLISMPVQDRLAMQKHLPEFFRRCLEQIKTEIQTGEVMAAE